MNNQITPQRQQEINYNIISALSSKQRYFNISPQVLPSASQKQKSSKVPSVLVYRDDDNLSIKQLLQKVKRQTKINAIKDAYGFQLESSIIILPEMTILTIKRLLRTNDIDGVCLYPYLYIEGDFNQNANNQLFLNAQRFYYSGEIPIACDIKSTSYTIYLHINGTQKTNKIKSMVANEILRIFFLKIQPKDFIIYHFDKQKQKRSQFMDYHIDQLIPNDRLQIQLKGVVLTVPKQNQSQLILKGVDADPIKTTILDYNEIRHTNLHDVLKKIDNKRQWKSYGLIVGQEVIKSNQEISKLNHIFAKSTVSNKHFVGTVVDEAQLFEFEQQKIKEKKKQFDLQSIITVSQSNLQLKDRCQSFCDEKAAQTLHPYFKNRKQSIKPILLYTSQLKVKGSSATSKQSAIYKVLNQFVRRTNFAQIPQSDYGKWEFIFQCDLMDQLKQLRIVEEDTVLWRGVDAGYPAQHKQEEKIRFKQFLSTTTKPFIAKNFSGGVVFKITKSYSGSSIKEYSISSYQDQVLFPPYTEFIVKKVSTTSVNFGAIVPCYQLEEIKKIPCIIKNKFHCILWVDANTIQGKALWSQFRQIHETTMMIQLISNNQLKKFFQQNSQLLKDNDVQIVMISNMTRVEDNVKNDYSGVDSIKIFRSYVPDGKIFIYVRSLDWAIQRLKKHQIQPSNILKVSIYENDLKYFLSKAANVK